MSNPMKVVFTDDVVKELILKHLHDKWKDPTGMDSSKVKISDLRSVLKEKYGLIQKQVIRNLQYLIEAGWVAEKIEERKLMRGSNIITSKNRSYAITNQGIDYFDEKSKFQKIETLAGINMGNVTGVVIVGNQNYVRNESVNLFKLLDELDGKIRLTDQLSDEDKINYMAEIKTIQSQLSKTTPEKSILSKSWDVIKTLSSIGSLASLIEKIWPYINQMIR